MTIEIEYKGQKKRYKRIGAARLERARAVYQNLLGNAVIVRVLDKNTRPP